MPLQNYQYDKIMREYSKTQSRNRRLLEEHKQEIYAKIPRIREIDEEVATLSTQKARALLSGQASGTEDLKAATCLRSGLPYLYAILILKIIWSFPTPAPCVRIRVM